MDNKTLANQFSLLAKLMTLHQENPFKIRSYSNAARQIDRQPKALQEMSLKEIGEIPGIGKAILQKIEVLLTTEQFPQLEEYQQNTPEGIRNMLDIKGIGPKKLTVIWKEMGIETPGELLYACEEDRLTRYKGFGKKTQDKIRKAVEYYLQSLGYYLLSEALSFSENLLSILKQKLKTPYKILPTGKLRRQCNTLSTLEYVTDCPLEKLKDLLAESFTETYFSDQEFLLELDHHPKVKFYYASAETLGSTLFQTTGNEAFLSSFYATYPEADKNTFDTEEALFSSTKSTFIPPYLREYPLNDLPECKTSLHLKDIKGIIHCHSKWSDGKNSIKEMALAAREKGLEYLVISDHSKSAGYANGLSKDRVIQQQQEVDQINKELAPFRVFKSIESDILSDGSLDYEEDILQSFDLVIASVHSNLTMHKAQATQRLLTAIAHPYTTILGHPTGRLLLSRKGYPIDYKAVIDACVAHQVVIEINAHPLRLDLDWEWIPYALKKGALLSINPDAHSIEGLALNKYGVLSAQKGGLTAERNLSSFSLEDFQNYLKNLNKGASY